MGLINTLLRAVTWWNGATLNTLIYTSRKGVKVGEDEQGNVFYRDRDDKHWCDYDDGTSEWIRLADHSVRLATGDAAVGTWRGGVVVVDAAVIMWQ